MGICVTKADREAADRLAASLLQSPQELSSAALRELIDQRKDRTVPVVSLAANSLYHRRMKTKPLESTCEDAGEDLSLC